MQREGIYPGGPRPPDIPGFEAAGIVESVGNTPQRAVGARVVCITPGGAHAKDVSADAHACIPLPDELSFIEGAAFPVQYLTAYHALTTIARAAEAETVLVHAAAGGLGTAAVQIARLLGLRVIGTASTREKCSRVLDSAQSTRSLMTHSRLRCESLPAVKGRISFSTPGGEALRRDLSLLPPLGRLVVLGLASRQAPAIDPGQASVSVASGARISSQRGSRARSARAGIGWKVTSLDWRRQAQDTGRAYISSTGNSPSP